jgi:amino acid adenylation domain-containing protein
LWILDRLEPGSAVYNVITSLWLDGQLDAGALERALGEIVRRHESLRTILAEDEQGPHQVILPPAPVAIAHDDVGTVAPERRETAALELARDEAARPFDLARGPMLRARLIRLDADRHLFVLNAHHVAVDGWSLGILYSELAKLYEAFVAGGASPLEEPATQYADYSLWQREHLESAGARRQLDYWRERFAGRVPVLELPGDRARPPVQSYRGAVVRHTLPADLYGAFKEIARREGATPFMALLAAFDVLLMRHAGQSDIVVGVGVANRRRQELESLIGFFVNTLVLRSDLSGDPSFRALLAQVRETTLDAYANQDIPIERLFAELDLERSLSHTPLFQVMLFFQNFPAEETLLPGLTMRPIAIDEVNSGSARADLSLFANELDGALDLSFEYASDLFDAATVEALAARFQALIASIVADPACRIGELALLPAQERRRLLSEWNATSREVPAASVHGMFAAQAARTPDAIAVEHEGQRLSYRELDAAADALAHTLAARGIGRGALVALVAERSPRMLVALLGVLKAGAAYVPMDPAYPAERLRFMLDDAAVAAIVTERALAAELPAHTRPEILLDDIDAGQVGAAIDVEIDGDDLAYVIFTSGSTGRPKGVQIPHRAVVNFLDTMAREPGLGAGDVVCAVTTLSFDIAVLELLLPLTRGARIVLADRATTGDGAALARLIEASGTTLMQATPATWRMLLAAGWQGRRDLRILCGGEALPRDLTDELLARSREVWNVYGPTETTVWSCLSRVEAGQGPPDIGRPIANTEVYVVDKRLRPVPPGVPGELLIGGSGLARGYLRRPELTAEKFVPDPFARRAGARLYRTGDLARWRRDGRLEVLGRIDHQVKLRGFRIELGEIEAALGTHPAVAQVVVVCREDRPGDKRLVAYVVARAEDAVSNSELRNHVKRTLPDYMVPAVCVFLPELPLTPNGKIDRRALPVPEAGGASAATYAAPRDEDEAQVAQIWAQVLGVERVGLDDNFFNLGGHSLLATQLIARVERTFAMDVPLRLLFEAPTLAAFCERLQVRRMELVDEGALAGLLDQIEDLSEADIQALLDEGETPA